MGRGSFHAKVLVLFVKNGRLKKYGGNAGGLSEKVCSCVCYLQT